MSTYDFRIQAGMSLAFGIISAGAAMGDGPLFPGAQYAAGDGTAAVAIGDLNGDQISDLAVANRYGDNVSVLLGVGDGTFVAAMQYTAGPGPGSIAIGDLNGDQVPDLAVANFGTGPNYEDGSVSVLLGMGDGTFAAPLNSAAGRAPGSLAIGDLDGDRIPDLAVANAGSFAFGDGNVSVLRGVGDGSFAASVNYAAGDEPYLIVIGEAGRRFLM